MRSHYEADGCHAAPIEPRAVVAQWEGNKVTIWTSTQVPFDARAGVCETLELPNNRVRIIVPHLGGGFGGKCGFHYEAHVAALARAAKRPVKLVFSRREEFLAPDRRREGIVYDFETGVKADGTITARKALAGASTTARTPPTPASSASSPPCMRSGRTRFPTSLAEAHLVYTNHQPSGSVRAPTAPQTCWALESHTDEVANAIGHGPSRVPQAQRGRHRRRRPERADLRRDRRAAMHRRRGRRRRVRPAARRRRSNRCRHRVVAQLLACHRART